MSGAPALRQIGAVINGRYLLKQRLGSGAAGEVFLATDGIAGHDVAIKFLVYRSTNQQAIDHFKGEFATLTTLRHPHITRVFDFAYDEQSRSYFFTSEYVCGDDILTVVQAHPPDAAIPLILQILQALDYLHSNRVYHFDIKPKNVLVALSAEAEDLRQAKVKMIDFGLASVNHANRLVGTPSYMAPEMIQRESPDHRADIYSLGVLLYYALTGVNPFRAENREETFKRHVTLQPPPPSTYNPLLPDFLDVLILHLLAKKRGDRPYSAAHVRAILLEHIPSDVDTASILPSPLQPWEVRFIGREAERERARAMLDACMQGAADRPPLLWVAGMSGSGKTRLLQEIKYHAQLMGFATHTLDRLDITARMAWLAAIDAAREQPHAPIAFFLDDITSLEGADSTREILEGLRELVERLRATLHISTATHPLRSVVVISGPDTPQTRTLLTKQLRIPVEETAQVRLESYSKAELTMYLRELVGPARAATSVDRVYAHTAGHPLRTAEYVAQLVDRQALTPEPSPPALSPSAQEIAHVLAVWATPATIHQLSATLGRPIEMTLLHSMVDHGLLQYDPLHCDFRFRSHSAQQHHYQAVEHKTRRQWHDQISALLLMDVTASLAQYFHHRLRGNTPYAAECVWWQLGEAHLEHRHYRVAATAWQQLLGTLSLTPDTGCWMDAHLRLADAHCHQHNFCEAMGIYRALREALRQSPAATQWLIHVLEALGKAALAHRLLHEAEAAFSEASAIATECAVEPVDELRLENWLATVALAAGDIAHATQTFEYTATAALRLPEPQRRHLTNQGLGLAYLQGQRFDDAVTTLTHDLHCWEAWQLTEPAFQCRLGLAKIDQLRGAQTTALTQYKELLAQAAKLAAPQHLFQIYCEMGHCHAADSHLDEAMQCYRAAALHAERLDDPWLCVESATLIGNIHRRCNEITAAEARFRFALAQLDTIVTDPAYAADRYCTLHYQLGTIYLRAAQLSSAEFHLTKAKALAAQSPRCRDQIYRIALAWADVLRAQGHRERYKAALAEAKILLETADHVHEMTGLVTIQEKQ